MDYITSKLVSISGILVKHCHVLPTGVKLLLYNSLFVFFLGSRNLVWGTTNKTNLQKSILTTKKIIRIECGMPCSHHTDQLFDSMGVLKIFQYYEF